MISIKKQEKNFLFYLFIVSFIIRAAVYQFYLKNDKNYWQVDSQTYHKIARGIAEEKGISDPDGTPNFYRLPGYPLFIAFFYKLFGVGSDNVLWWQILLASFIPLLVYILSLVMFPSASLLAKIAGSYSAVHLGLVLYSGFFMTESLFIFFLLLFFIFFFQSIHLWFSPEKDKDEKRSKKKCTYIPPAPDLLGEIPPFAEFYDTVDIADYAACMEVDYGMRSMLLSGVFLGIASLIRPVGHYLLLVALLMILISNAPWKRKRGKALMVSFYWLIPVAGWLIRNFVMTGYLFFHTLPGGHFLYLSAARVAAKAEGYSYIEARKKLGDEVAKNIKTIEKTINRQLIEIEKCYEHEKVARKYFISYPWTTIKTWMTDIVRTCLSLYSAELLYIDGERQPDDYFNKDRSWWAMFKKYLMPETENNLLKGVIYGEIILFLLLLIGFAGALYHASGLFFKKVSKKGWQYLDTWGKALPFMILFIVISLAGGYARMRLPIEPLLIIFSLSFWLPVFGLKGKNDSI